MTTHHLAAVALTVFYVLFCWYFLRPRTAPRGAAFGNSTGQPLLIGYASQSGQAQQLAENCAEQLQHSHRVLLLPLNHIRPEQLQNTRLALFFVSTYGEGEAPDNGLRFAQQWLRQARTSQTPQLNQLHFAVLALGDSSYRKFCSFGLQLEHGLQQHGATALFDAVKTDQLNAQALTLWQTSLAEHGLNYETEHTTTEEEFCRGTLLEQRLLNAGSAGDPAFLIRITPHKNTRWQAGDILQVLPCNDARHPLREYSIASIPQDITLELLVRQVRKSNGEYGVGSGWLSRIARPGEDIALRIRRNPSFHAPAPETPLILVGNGTGIAGLRALLKERALLEHSENILFFGERNRAHDFFFEDEIQQWQQQNILQQVHLAFSRDYSDKYYVQHLLNHQSDVVQQWVNRGAAIYVCGSLEGMAGAVDQVLEKILGKDTVTEMKMNGRYRRDVY